MAQHPFAQKAREELESNGVIFNPDGSTSRIFVGGEETQTETETETTNNAPQSTNDTEPKKDEIDKDRLLEMQRKELEELRNMKSKWETTKVEPQKSQREVELENELEELRSKIASQTKQEQADEFRELLNRQEFNSENLDDDVLLEVRDKIFLPAANKINALEERMAKVEERNREPTQEERINQNKNKVQARIKEQIPDFDTIYASKEFKDRLGEKDDRFPTETYGEVLQLAYENGNADFIIREIKNFMGGNNAQTLGDIADVGATNGVGTTTTDTEGSADGYTYTNDEAIEMLRKAQFGAITRQQYSEYRAKLDAYRASSK